MEEGYYKNDYDKIQQESAFWVSAYTGTVTAIILITLPTVGVISDVIGRRKALFLTPVSQLLQCLIYICIVGSGMQFPTGLLLLPGIIPALVADVSGLYVFASSYITAITTVEERTLRMTLLDAAALMASVTATLSSGFIIERFGYIGIYVLIIALEILAFCDLVFFIKPDGDIGKEIGRDSHGVEVNRNNGDISVVPEWEEVGESDGDTKGCNLLDDQKRISLKKESFIEQKDVQFAQRDLGNQINETLQGKGFSTVSYKKSKLGQTENSNDDFQSKATCELEVLVHTKRSPTKQSNTEAQQNAKVNIRKILQHSNPIKNFKSMFHALKSLKHEKIGFALLLIMGLATLGYFGEASVVILYVKSAPFHFTAKEVGFFLAYENAIIGIFGLLLFNWVMQKVFKLSDIVVLLLTSITCIPYHILMGFANSTAMLYSIQILHAVCSVNTPTVRSILSKMANESSTGAVLGAAAMVETLAVFVTGLAIPTSYAGLIQYYRGAVFFLLSGIMLLAVGIISVCVYVFPKDISNIDYSSEAFL